MAFDLQSARHWAQVLISEAVGPGARVVDATLGNGRDAEWLLRLVGDEGMVYGFDVQPRAVEVSMARLEAAGLIARARLFCAGHERMAEFVNEPVDGVLFNLGWLPGGDKAITTRAETTVAAAGAALELLKPGGLMTMCVYPGHAEGSRELSLVTAWASKLPADRFDAMIRAYLNQPGDPPVLIAVQKKR